MDITAVGYDVHQIELIHTVQRWTFVIVIRLQVS
jgi:hypothetical protein